ncbi:PspA/IM30 family protein [Rubrivirga sp. S365]|uniref:PspA/IM30 family protein n=1 Tax=Rubrivirga litoralis TaxID=3075598 RepID=A0ABU3BU79_9BACT|nr:MULTISPECIES: PspA/IM30 family protein [unclassified Rubrivirga]MDT0632852.1 PspA/IM30 family protein [Rubrivirga sp. F394]MDT7855156.1 PspA/IM30 family protein [Rubrivirga sp. S365]
MWKRFTRLIKSMFGGAVSAMEDPRLILEQNIRELNDQVPKMNENIATVKANAMLLQKEHRKYTAEQQALTNKIKAAINAGRDDIAQRYAVQLQSTKEAQARTGEQLEFAEQAYEKSLQVKKAFMREREKKISEAKEALRTHERAKWQAKIADTLEQFEVAGVDQTHSEMIRRVNEQSAKNEARMEMALDSVDTEAMQIEEDAQELQGAELVKQFKLEMGVSESPARESAPAPALQIPDEPAPAERTAGRDRTRTE